MTPVRVAVDLMGTDHGPAAVVAGSWDALRVDPALSVSLVGLPEVLAAVEVPDDLADRVALVAAQQVVEMDDDPARAVRSKRDASVRVAARLVRDREADACAGFGSTGAALAAAVFTLGRLPGVTRPPLAAVIPALHGPLVLLDVGATTEAGPDLLAQFALLGAVLAEVRLGLARPRVGLLTVGEEAGKGDAVRKAAHDTLAGLDIDFVGNVEGHDVPLGGRADVVVADGFTGNVLLKGLEGCFALLSRTVRQAVDDPAFADAVAQIVGPVTAAVEPLSPDRLSGAVLLGVKGVSIVGHGATGPLGVESAVGVAATSARADLAGLSAARISGLVQARRAAAGLGPRAGGPASDADGSAAGPV